MFETMTDRIAGTVLMGLDAAVEFATLGEYRLVGADAFPAPYDFQAAPLVRRPPRMTAVEPDHKLLPPASTAIARAAAESAARAAARRNGGLAVARGAAMQPHGAKAVIQSAPRRRPPAPVHAPGKPSPRQRA